MKTITKLWIIILILAILAPIGLILPAHFKAGAAWGEWGAEEIKAMIGYIPKGLERLSSLWNAPVPDYAFKGWEDKPLAKLGFAYVFSALAGIIITVGLVFLIGKFISRKE